MKVRGSRPVFGFLSMLASRTVGSCFLMRLLSSPHGASKASLGSRKAKVLGIDRALEVAEP